ncbi:hypothetical protein [Arenimonas sp.]|uniref:hypothetical protein n=1 Tax=Arenimonas sp. TaxID=1872635 RepID=UPI0039E4AAB4
MTTNHSGEPALKRLGAMLLAIGLAISGQAFADEPAPKTTGGVQVVLAMSLDGWVDVDAGGKVVGYGTDVPVPEELRANVDRAVRAWLFEPVPLREGKMAARTRMRLTLRAEPQGQGYVARIEDVLFLADPAAEAAAVSGTPAPIVIKSTRKPRMMLGGIATGTLIAIKVGLDGRVEDAVAVQSVVMDDAKAAFMSVMGPVEKSMIEAVKKWKFRVDFAGRVPTPEMQTVLVGMFFNPDLTEAGVDQGVWHHMALSPRRPVPWLAADSVAKMLDVTETRNGDILPLVVEGRMRLRSGVVE